MEEIIKRCGINLCSRYSQKSSERYCYDGLSAVKVSKGDFCYLGHKVKPKKSSKSNKDLEGRSNASALRV